jgi:phosphate transport system substrate-binding protein
MSSTSISRLRSIAGLAVLGLFQASGHAQQTDALPAYKPQSTQQGVVRIYGSKMSGLVEVWEKGFGRYQPGIRFENKFPSSDGWSAGMEAGGADIGSSGREVMLVEYLSFNETFGYDPTEITVASGAYDKKGKTWAITIYVNKDNPISRLSMRQLDGIFGSERTGGYRGLKWMPQLGRGAEQNIRTWGQLGLTGEWADKPIHTYGYAFTGMTNFFELKVFNNGDKWNPNYREYVEYGTKMVADGPIGQTGSIKYMLTEELAKDKYGIAWTGVPHTADVPQVKPLALQAEQGGPYVAASKETVQNRTYPLARSIYLFLKRPPGKPLEPKVREFMRYVLSKQGQEDVAGHDVYLPLPAEVVREQLKKLE